MTIGGLMQVQGKNGSMHRPLAHEDGQEYTERD